LRDLRRRFGAHPLLLPFIGSSAPVFFPWELCSRPSALGSGGDGGVSDPPSDVSNGSPCQGGSDSGIWFFASGSGGRICSSASTSDGLSTPPSDVSNDSSFQGGSGSTARGCVLLRRHVAVCAPVSLPGPVVVLP
jgi:hypothetical protein